MILLGSNLLYLALLMDRYSRLIVGWEALQRTKRPAESRDQVPVPLLCAAYRAAQAKDANKPGVDFDVLRAEIN
ncbi:MAG TPA: hypothetical protein VJ783_16570 [Pirellulales bacterium]|nr:hypothetical protein [Pirellulales bacterium]